MYLNNKEVKVLTEFSYLVDAIEDPDYCWIYCVSARSFTEKMSIKDFPSNIGGSYFHFKDENEEAKKCNFALYVNEHLFKIISGNDPYAKVSALIVELDFSLTITIFAKETSIFYPDSCVEFEVKTNGSFLGFDLTVSNIYDEKNDLTKCYRIWLDEDALEITEYRGVEENSDDFSEYQKKNMLIFRKSNHPKIEVTQFS